MCFESVHFQVPHAELKQKIYHASTGMHPINSYFQDLFKFTKRHLWAFFPKQLNFIPMLHFHGFFIFVIFQ